MTNPFRKVQPGEPLEIPAQAWNRVADAVLAHEAGNPSGSGYAWPESVLVRNDSGTDVDRFGVLEVSEPLILPADNLPEFQRQTALSGVTPSGTDNAVLAILLEPAADGEIARAVLDGLVVVQVDVSDAGHGFADASTGDTAKLTSQSAASPQQILWKESGTGTKWALLRMSSIPSVTSSGGGIEVKEADSNPDLAGVSVLVFDQTTGFKVSQPSAGQAKVEMCPASKTQAGIVTTTAQDWSGWKSSGGWQVNLNDPNGSDLLKWQDPSDVNNYCWQTYNLLAWSGWWLGLNHATNGTATLAYTIDGTTTLLIAAGPKVAYSVHRDADVQRDGVDGSFVVAGAGADAGKTITVTVYGGIVTGINKA